MKANDYQMLASRKKKKNLYLDEMEIHAILGMASEVGELQGIYQKEYQGHEFDEAHAKKELGDLLWFIAEYCTAMEWCMEEVMQENIDKLKERYPEGFKAEQSLNRKEGDI